jgi:hypothetical protein
MKHSRVLKLIFINDLPAELATSSEKFLFLIPNSTIPTLTNCRACCGTHPEGTRVPRKTQSLAFSAKAVRVRRRSEKIPCSQIVNTPRQGVLPNWHEHCCGTGAANVRFRGSLSRELPEIAWCDKNPRDPSTRRPSINRAITLLRRFAQEDRGWERLQRQAEGRRFFCCGGRNFL